MTLLKEKLAAVVLKVYPLSFDNCNVSDQFFTDAKYADAAKKGIAMAKTVDFTRPGIFQEKYVKAMFCELPAVFHESALIERFHGFIKGWNIPRMNDDLKISGWALNSEYFCSILHELRDDTTYRSIVDALVVVPAGADTRDTEAVKRIATAYLKLLFPNVKKPEDIDSRDFNRYSSSFGLDGNMCIDWFCMR